MTEKFEKVKELYEEEVSRLDTKHALEIIELIIETFKKVKKIQPLLKCCYFGNGAWSIEGIGKGVGLEDGEIVEIEDFKDYIKCEEYSVIDTPFNKSCTDLVELCDYLVDENGLNCSTIISEINEKGTVDLRI